VPVVADGLEQLRSAEIGPEHVAEVQLGVGEPVEQEVGDATLTTGTDDEIGIAVFEAGHEPVEGLAGDLFRGHLPLGHAARELFGGLGDFFSPSVAERQVEGHLVLVAALAAQGVEHRPNHPRQAANVANGVQTNAVVEDFVALGEQELPEQGHESVDLELRPRPVLLAKCVQSERPKAQTPGNANDATHGLGTLAVALDAGKAALLRPTPVAVHDDADVGRQVPRFNDHSLSQAER